MQNAVSLLNNKDIKPSFNRILVLEYLLENRIHPTADDMYSTIKESNPTLSKMTIYNVLNLFVEKNLVRAITISDKETRYDVNVEDHGHFKCNKCGNIFDFEVELSTIIVRGIDEFEVSQKDVFYYGTCSQCIEK